MSTQALIPQSSVESAPTTQWSHRETVLQKFASERLAELTGYNYVHNNHENKMVKLSTMKSRWKNS